MTRYGDDWEQRHAERLRRPTTDEAREALLAAFVGNATDGPIAKALEPRIDALIAAVRAEYEPLLSNYIDAISAAEAKLAALREAAVNVSDRRTLMDDGFWVSQKEMRALDAALAATPAEDGEGRT